MISKRAIRWGAHALVLAAAAWACSQPNGTDNMTGVPQPGVMKILLTDGPLSTSLVQSVNIFIVRVDARLAASDSAGADSATTGLSATQNGWTTIALPDSAVNLLAYQGGTMLALGGAVVGAGSYAGLRMVIDPTQSNIVLKDGTVLTATSNPGILFPNEARVGINIVPPTPVAIPQLTIVTVYLDFLAGLSFTLVGSTIQQGGLVFTPMISATLLAPGGN